MGRSYEVSHHPAKSCDDKYHGIGNFMVEVCHVILQDHVIKGSGNMFRSHSRLATFLPSLVAVGVVVVEI